MKTKYHHTVLYYPTGIVHFRNLELLKKSLPGFRFIVIVEPWVKESAPETLNYIEAENLIIVQDGRLPAEIWEHPIDILFLCMAYPNLFRLHLVYEAVKRNIPVVSIEEVNQLALNDGIINHYFLPLDYLGVPSAVEKEKFAELGIPSKSITVTGWPFFNKAAAVKKDRDLDLRAQYKIPQDWKICLLILGSLKEYDMVSLETRRIRQEILEIISMGLADYYRLFIKPHPIESEETIKEIQAKLPTAILVNPKFPIETLLSQADVIVNRGNSQVALLALTLNKPLIILPVKLKTIFHNLMDSIIADNAQQFRRVLGEYSWGKTLDYKKALAYHFPLTQEEAVRKVQNLFTQALEKRIPDIVTKKICIAVLYAFLRDIPKAREIIHEHPGYGPVPLLEKLFNHTITPEEFKTLKNALPGKISQWHLQALYIRMLIKCKDTRCIIRSVPFLEGFDGDVNPHYFIDEIIDRIELEYIAGREFQAKKLLDKFREDYSVFDYYKQAFDMLVYVYNRVPKGGSARKALWLLKNITKPYTRKWIKDKLTKKR